MHGAFGTIAAPAGRPGCRGAQTIIQTMQGILDAPFRAIPDLIRGHAAQQPRHAALVHEGRMLDYGGLDALMDRVAAALQRDGLEPQDTIAICAGTSLEYAAVFLGALRAGIAVAPLAPSSTAQSLERMLADAVAKRLFLDAAASEALAPVRERIAAQWVALDASLGARAFGRPFDDWVAAEGARPDSVSIRPEWAFNIIYSSGTTGAPKGIVQPHAMRWGHLQRAAPYGYGPDAVTLLATPLYSNTTLVGFFPTLGMGGTAVLMGRFDAAAYLALAERHRATHTMLVPVQYQRIMALADFHRFDLASFRFKLCTSAPFAASLKADILKRWPGGLVEFYGLTEGGGTCILAAHEHPHKLHTVGRPAPGHDIRLIGEAGREVAAGEAGEVVGRSSVMMSGYHNRPAMTAEAEWFDAAGTRYIRSGDIGRFDADGFLTLLDRKKDMIISGGFNIYPSDLESVLREHAEVAEVAVVGVPSARWGETPVAFVVLETGSAASAGALLVWANGRLGKTQRLAAVELIVSLPRSAIGKVMKRELREAYAKQAGAPARPAAD
jgi:acyl-CoA synthetase (AMP-forming)/AMP-acid ligase II